MAISRRGTPFRRPAVRCDRRMTEAEADRRSKELNRELGAALEPRAYYVPVKREGGEWEVERRQSKLGLIDRILGALPP